MPSLGNTKGKISKSIAKIRRIVKRLFFWQKIDKDFDQNNDTWDE